MSYVFSGSNFVVQDLRIKIQQQRNPNYPYGWRGSGSRFYRRLPRQINCVVYHQTAGSLVAGEQGPLNTAKFSTRDPNFHCPQCGRHWQGSKKHPHDTCPLCKSKGLNTGYGNGFPGMPYHVFVPWAPLVEAGKYVVYQCQDFEETTWHAPRANSTGVAVAFQGFFRSRHLRHFVPWPGTDGNPSPVQQQLALTLWREWLQPTLTLLTEEVTGHFEYGKPSCPGDWLENCIRQLRKEPPLTIYASTDPAAGLFDTWQARQAALYILGYDLGTSGPLKNGVDGKPGHLTKLAISAFEANHNLVVDGIWDAQVQQAMTQLFHSQGLPHEKLRERLALEIGS